MTFVGRSRELGLLRAAFDRREASVIRVTGMRGVGKSAVVSRAVEGLRYVHHRCMPFPDPLQRDAIARLLGPGLEADDPLHGGEPPTWSALLDVARERAEPEGPPFVLVLDDAHRLAAGRSRYADALGEGLRTARDEGRALHIVLVSHAPTSLEGLEDVAGPSVHIPTLPFRVASRLLPRGTPQDLIRAYSIFGGVPRVLTQLDPGTTLGTNLRNSILEVGAPLSELPTEWLERDLQNPTRYYAVMSGLSHGEADWGAVHDSVPDLTTSGQVAPYLQRLEELGLVQIGRSLDAAPRGRSRRYRIADPFLAFWFRFVLPRLHDPTPRDPTAWATEVRGELDGHVRSVFPSICRQYMRHDAVESMGANAREVGGLWGSGYDIGVAGILRSGAAFYGACHWPQVEANSRPIDALDASIRETRYGFGREARLRLLFVPEPLDRALEREVARREDTRAIGAAELLGTGPE